MSIEAHVLSMSPTTQRRRTRMRTGLLCSLLGLALLCFAPSAQAGLLEDINSQRASGGLPEVHASDPIARSAAQELSSNTGENRSTIMDPDRRNSDEYDFEENRFCGCDDVRTENSGFWRLRADWSLEKNLRAAPYARAVLFDPRVTTLDVVEDHQTAAVAVTIDPDISWQAPVIAAQVPADPSQPLYALVPPGEPKFLMLDLKHSWGWGDRAEFSINPAEDTEYDTALAEAGIEGAALVPLTETSSRVHDLNGVTLAYRAVYRMVVGGQVSEFRTTDLPAKDLSRTFRFERSISPKLRRLYKRYVGRGNPIARRMLERIDGQIYVGATNSWRSTACCYSGATDRYEIKMTRAYLTAGGPSAAHIVWHEIGHIIAYSSLQGRATTAFEKLLRLPRGFRCGNRGECGTGEVFADNFAFWATGNRAQRSGYNIPPLSSRARFGALLAHWQAYHPAYYDGS